jgi:hypothetical protein
MEQMLTGKGTPGFPSSIVDLYETVHKYVFDNSTSHQQYSTTNRSLSPFSPPKIGMRFLLKMQYENVVTVTISLYSPVPAQKS